MILIFLPAIACGAVTLVLLYSFASVLRRRQPELWQVYQRWFWAFGDTRRHDMLRDDVYRRITDRAALRHLWAYRATFVFYIVVVVLTIILIFASGHAA